jgi:hypothetical protein
LDFFENRVVGFASDNADGVDSLADQSSGFLVPLPANIVDILEVGPEGANGFFYTPVAGQPGFTPDFAVMYHILSDGTLAVAEPATLALLASGLLVLLLGQRRASQCRKSSQVKWHDSHAPLFHSIALPLRILPTPVDYLTRSVFLSFVDGVRRRRHMTLRNLRIADGWGLIRMARGTRCHSYVLCAALTATLTLSVWPTAPREANAGDYVFPSAANTTYLVNNSDLSTILGDKGNAAALPANASTTRDELVGLIQFNSTLANGSGTNLIPAGTNLQGMFGDLNLLLHARNNGTGSFTPIADITPATPLVGVVGDVLYFGALGRNQLSPANASDTAAGGYLILSDNKTGFSFNGVGNGAMESPQNFVLRPSGTLTTVTAAGLATNNDNFSNGTGTAIDPSRIVLAARFQGVATITGMLPPSGIPYSAAVLLANAPPGTDFIEVLTDPVSATDNRATRAIGFGYLDVPTNGGSSFGSFLQNSLFTTANTVGDVPDGGNTELVFTIHSQFNLGAPATYTQFDSSSSDPLNYIGSGQSNSIPEPSSVMLVGLGAASLGLYGSLRGRRREYLR